MVGRRIYLMSRSKINEILYYFFYLFYLFFNYSWHSILYQFQVYITAVRRLYNLWRDLPISLVPARHHTQFLQHYWVCALCFTLYPHGYFVTANFHFLIPSSFSPSSPITLSLGNHQFVLYICEFVSVLFAHLFCFLYSTFISEKRGKESERRQ